MTPPVLLHITSHRTDCPGAARAFLQPNKRHRQCQFSWPSQPWHPRPSILSTSEKVNLLKQADILLLKLSYFAFGKMHVIIPVCAWAPSRAWVLKYECKCASAQQTKEM